MKVVFDTNVYIAEALVVGLAARLVDETHARGWRVYVSDYLLDEFERVLVDHLHFSRRLAALGKIRIRRRAKSVALPPSRHSVPQDAKDSPILQTALQSGADYLVTNDRHLRALDPYEGLRILSISDYHQMLLAQGSSPD